MSVLAQGKARGVGGIYAYEMLCKLHLHPMSFISSVGCLFSLSLSLNFITVASQQISLYILRLSVSIIQSHFLPLFPYL